MCVTHRGFLRLLGLGALELLRVGLIQDPLGATARHQDSYVCVCVCVCVLENSVFTEYT